MLRHTAVLRSRGLRTCSPLGAYVAEGLWEKRLLSCGVIKLVVDDWEEVVPRDACRHERQAAISPASVFAEFEFMCLSS